MMIFRILEIKSFGPISSEVPVSTMAWQPPLQAIIFLFMEMLRDGGMKNYSAASLAVPKTVLWLMPSSVSLFLWSH